MDFDQINVLIGEVIWPLTLLIIALIFKSRLQDVFAAIVRLVDRVVKVRLERKESSFEALAEKTRDIERSLRHRVQPVADVPAADDRQLVASVDPIQAVRASHDVLRARLRNLLTASDPAIALRLDAAPLDELAITALYNGRIPAELEAPLDMLTSIYNQIISDTEDQDAVSLGQSFVSLTQAVLERIPDRI